GLFCSAALLAQGARGTAAEPARPGAGPNVAEPRAPDIQAPSSGAGINVQGPRGGNVDVQPGGPADRPNVDVQGPRGGNVNVQPNSPAGGANINVQRPQGTSANVPPVFKAPAVDPRANVDARARAEERGDRRSGDIDRWRYRWDGGRWWYYS